MTNIMALGTEVTNYYSSRNWILIYVAKAAYRLLALESAFICESPTVLRLSSYMGYKKRDVVILSTIDIFLYRANFILNHDIVVILIKILRKKILSKQNIVEIEHYSLWHPFLRSSETSVY